MFVLKGKLTQRGFYIERNGQIIADTRHKFGLFPTSRIVLGTDLITIRPANLIGNKCSIFKNGHKIGKIDFSYYKYSSFHLIRQDGTQDVFRLDEEGYAQTYILSNFGHVVLRFKASINPMRLDQHYTVEVLSEAVGEYIEELLIYAGETLFRLNASRSAF